MKPEASHNPQEWVTTFIDGCQEMALDHLQPFVQKMFENCHLALLEFTEKAQSSTSQIQFMEAGTSIQKNRKQVEDIFYRELKQGFTDFRKTSTQGFHRKPESTASNQNREEQLSLLSMEEADVQVAIQNMVAGASLGSTHELTAIRQRLSVLNNGIKLEEKQIPAGPCALTRAFQKATGVLVLEHEVMLIVYLLFDKFVLSNTAPMYHEFSDRLQKAGLLPNLKYEVRKHPHAPQTSHKEKAQTTHGDGTRTQAETGSHPGGGGYSGGGNQAGNNRKSLGDELFDSILELMSGRSTDSRRQVTNPVPQADLVSAIHEVQQSAGNRNTAPCPAADPATPEQAVAGMVAGLSAEREQLFRGIDRRRLPSADTQMIDLVGMMFEYLLNDDEIPNVAKAELSRLHTPYLKVAILDKTLFSDNHHPAHELLDELARASTRWVFEDNLERGIFPCMRKIIMRVILDFRDDLDIFTELLDLLHTSLHDLENKAVVVEEHSRMAAEGKEKLELARLRADSEIIDAVSQHQVPDAIREMLGSVWRDKLMFIYLRKAEADQSDSWALAKQTIDSILWCVEPRSTTAELAELQQRHLDVMEEISQSIGTLGAYGSSDAAAEISLIQEYMHTALETGVVTAGPVEPVDEALQADTVTDQQDPVLQPVAPPVDCNIPPPVATAAEEELDTVSFGTWFSIQKDESYMPVQAKLSWYSEISGNYMFVDSLGIRLAVIKRNELVEMLVSGRAEIMAAEQQPLIRRAMEAIRRLLGSDQPALA